MLKRVQHDKKQYVIPNLFRNLELGNNKTLIECLRGYDFMGCSVAGWQP